MDDKIWLIDDDWYAGDKASNDSVGPYIHADCLRKLVERMRNVAGCTEPTVDAGEAVDYWADEIEKLLNGGE